MAEVKQEKKKTDFAFGRTNYILMTAGLVVLLIGFLLLSGGGSRNSEVFAGETLFNTRRLVVAPIVIIVGFIIEIFAIMHRPKDN